MASQIPKGHERNTCNRHRSAASRATPSLYVSAPSLRREMSITQVVFKLSDRAMARLIGLGEENVVVAAAHQACHAQKTVAAGFCTTATRAGARIKKHRK